MSSKNQIRDTATDIGTTPNNLNHHIQRLTQIDEVAEHYTPRDALELIQLIYSMHGAFDSIIQVRKVATSFEMLSNVGFEYGLSLFKILDSNGFIKDPPRGPGALSKSSISVMRQLFFGKQTPDEESAGLLMWYLEPNNIPILCEIVNPYDDEAREIASLIKKWDGWESLEGKQREDYIKYQKKQTGTNKTIPEPVVWDKIIHQYPDLASDWGPVLRAKIDGWSKEKKASATDRGNWWKQYKKTFSKIRDEPFDLPTALKEHLGGSGVPNLDPDANLWMKSPTTPGFKLDRNKIITIQQLTADNFDGDTILTAIGREIKLDTLDKLNNCVLIPSINLATGYTEETLFDSNITQTWPDDIFLTGSAIQQLPSTRFGPARNWKGIFDKCMRDNYGPLGDPPAQNDVDYYYRSNPDGKNPTPGRRGKNEGLVCAICAGITPRPGKKVEWMTELATNTQTWDVDHIANLIFNELFNLNNPNGDGRGFLNTCDKCNRQFKSEKIWSPSYNLWKALLQKAANNDAIEYDRLMRLYPWPGLAAPGIVQSGKPPFEGYRVYMTQAYYTDGDQAKAQQDYNNTLGVNLENRNKVKAGVPAGKSIQQANGIDFSNRQNSKMRNSNSGKMQIHPFQLEAIILNRFYLITKTTLGTRVIANEIRTSHTGKEAIYGEYSNLIDIYPIAASIIDALEKTREQLSDANNQLQHTASQDERGAAIMSGVDIEDQSWSMVLESVNDIQRSLGYTSVSVQPKPVASAASGAAGRIMNYDAVHNQILKRNMKRELDKVKGMLRNLRQPDGLTNSPMWSRTANIPKHLLYENILKPLVPQGGGIFQIPPESINKLADGMVRELQPPQITHQNTIWKKELDNVKEAKTILEGELAVAQQNQHNPGHIWESPGGTGIATLEKEIHITTIRIANCEVFLRFGRQLERLKRSPPRRCGIFRPNEDIISNPGGGPLTLQPEIRTLRFWYSGKHKNKPLVDDANQQLADSGLLEVTEQDTVNSAPTSIHWWTGNLMREALVFFCGPVSQWHIERSQFGGADAPVIRITDHKDPNRVTIVIELKQGVVGNHWVIKVKPPIDCFLPLDRDGFYNIPDPAGRADDEGEEWAVPYELAFHRNGGDCGPAAVALAIRYKMDPRLMCATLATYEARQQYLITTQKFEAEMGALRQRMRVVQHLSAEIGKYGAMGVFTPKRSQELMTTLSQLNTLEEIDAFETGLVQELAIKGKTLKEDGGPGFGKRKRNGGKRTRKKRRKRGKTKRKRKYRKKTKGRKRRRKKRTRRK